MKQNLKTAAIAFAVTLLLFGVAFSAYRLWNILRDTQKATQEYADVQQKFAMQAEKNAPAINWSALQEQYPDVMAWLSCPDTDLNYPVVQGQDNSHYLTHLPNGEANKHGAVFMDCRNGQPLTDENTIIYGHNMNDGTMFHGLLNWGNADYAAAHPALYLQTSNKTYELMVFNACVITANSAEYLLDFENTNKAAWLDQCARQSYFTADFEPSVEMPVVTFSTCSGKGHWFVVQASAMEFQREEDEK